MAITKGSIIIQRKDGTIYDLHKEGIEVVSFDPPSPNFQHTYTQNSKYGATLTTSQIQQMNIPIVFDVFARDNADYELQRLKVLRIFDSTEPFYVINRRLPWQRWRVVAEAFNYPRSGNFWKAKSVSFNLVAIDGLAESVGTTLDPFIFDDAKWGIGMGIPYENQRYSFNNQSSFNVYNPSIIPLLANERPVVITFKGNAPNGLTIRNSTTGQLFNYKKSLSSSDEFQLVGIVPIINGQQRLGNDFSDRGFVDFVKGDNQITISGASNFSISFNTRFYY
ncbi:MULTISPECIES: phage tail domain-containing protein [Convivina]|uniref:Tail protein n=1 Tax=Convivina intestini TaxID=1505726 RepID=A0A2U1DFN8_9LACO|nr:MULTISPECIES: phage tail domain-containing protein [Convivina]PVY86506.1 tail protein [Convivina intestini]CAH1853335.1 hypothetical protein R077815_00802 [Convivina sp. LMG 32447]CAH1857596.1 hypothetical protein R077811_01622 [Convivina intestini]SDC12835.1 Phage tail protein [Leuconostocaceae bacterium R-53105]